MNGHSMSNECSMYMPSNNLMEDYEYLISALPGLEDSPNCGKQVHSILKREGRTPIQPPFIPFMANRVTDVSLDQLPHHNSKYLCTSHPNGYPNSQFNASLPVLTPCISSHLLSRSQQLLQATDAPTSVVPDLSESAPKEDNRYYHSENHVANEKFQELGCRSASCAEEEQLDDLSQEVDNFILDMLVEPSDAEEQIPVAAFLVDTIDLFSAGVNNRKRERPFLIGDDIEQEESFFKSKTYSSKGNECTFPASCTQGNSILSTSTSGGSMTQDDHWNEKFRELCQYREEHGDCMVPHNFKDNLPLARWVKRQRHQMKQIMEQQQQKEGNGPSSSKGLVLSKLMQERVKALEKIGFVWDCQGTNWEEKVAELREYRGKYGDCNVPSNYSENPKLGMWVKCQRRQYKLYKEGKQSSMTPERIAELSSLGFNWGLRKYKKKIFPMNSF